MNQNDAVTHATAAAAVVIASDQAPGPFLKLFKSEAMTLALYLDRHPAATAEALYEGLRVISARPIGVAWGEALPSTRCAFELFRATYLVLMSLVRELAIAEKRERGEDLGHVVLFPGTRMERNG